MKPSTHPQILALQQKRWAVLEVANLCWNKGLDEEAAELEDQAHAMYMLIEEEYRKLYNSPTVAEQTNAAYMAGSVDGSAGPDWMDEFVEAHEGEIPRSPNSLRGSRSGSKLYDVCADGAAR